LNTKEDFQMKVSERIAKLRALMAEKGIDAYVVPTADSTRVNM
jgi:Creatinase/Prolidase N-terminal domain.